MTEFGIDPIELPGGYRHLKLGSVGSTNEIAAQYVRDGDPGKLWVTADEQITGKGSRGRGWISEPGNLYSSLLLRDNIEPKLAPTLAFAISLGLHAALSHFTGSRRLQLKWPNDVLLEGGKISGILLENHASSGQSALVVGIGVNCAHHPQKTTHAATNLADHSIMVQPMELFAHLVDEMAAMIAHWDKGRGFASIRKLWLENAFGLGEPITARIMQEEHHGVFEDLDSSGQLLLRLSNGMIKKLSVADIFFS